MFHFNHFHFRHIPWHFQKHWSNWIISPFFEIKDVSNHQLEKDWWFFFPFKKNTWHSWKYQIVVLIGCIQTLEHCPAWFLSFAMSRCIEPSLIQPKNTRSKTISHSILLVAYLGRLRRLLHPHHLFTPNFAVSSWPTKMAIHRLNKTCLLHSSGNQAWWGEETKSRLIGRCHWDKYHK